MFVYAIWQTLYYYGVIVYRARKIAEEGRVTSFTYLLNSKKGLIANILHKIRPENRARYFIMSQAAYTVVTMMPGFFLLYTSKLWSAVYCWIFFSVSVVRGLLLLPVQLLGRLTSAFVSQNLQWNGASFYMEVYGRRFEKEFNKLKGELEALNQEVADSRAAAAARRSLDTLATGEGSVGSSVSGATTPALASEPEGDAEDRSGAATPTSSYGMSRQVSLAGEPSEPSTAASEGGTDMSRSSSTSSVAPEEAPAILGVKDLRRTASPLEKEEGSGGSSSGSVKSGSDSWINVAEGQKHMDREATPKP